MKFVQSDFIGEGYIDRFIAWDGSREGNMFFQELAPGAYLSPSSVYFINLEF